ncbi:CHRNB2 [Mytilus coruscus]|uniref:CHRNB2 n=1 Tax=Mytilus coruscus TaxID=42192 RepID=A0A6J8CJS5_MYTCO|nr:CHRNB2 [Mytilus coruscus]
MRFPDDQHSSLDKLTDNQSSMTVKPMDVQPFASVQPEEALMYPTCRITVNRATINCLCLKLHTEMKNCLFIFAIFIEYAYCQTDTDAKNLLTNLFTTQSYNKLVRPTTNQSNPTTIYLEFFLYGINAFDEIQQKLTTTAYLEIYWYDELLTWTPSSYGDLADIFLPQEDIWRPDIALENGFKDLESLGSKFIHAEVDYDGLVLWKPFHVFDSKCKLDSTYFPFEKQSCNIDFIAWAFDDSEVYLEVGTDGVNTEDATDSNGQWELVSSSIVSFSDEGVSQVRATLVIKRKPLFFIINIILPIVLLSVLNIFTFQIPADWESEWGTPLQFGCRLQCF